MIQRMEAANYYRKYYGSLIDEVEREASMAEENPTPVEENQTPTVDVKFKENWMDPETLIAYYAGQKLGLEPLSAQRAEAVGAADIVDEAEIKAKQQSAPKTKNKES
jgi:hypothetical protein